MATWKKPYRVLDGNGNKISSGVHFQRVLSFAANLAKERVDYTAIVVGPSGKDLAICTSGSAAVNRKRVRDSSGRQVKVIEQGASRKRIAACTLTPAGRATLKRGRKR